MGHFYFKLKFDTRRDFHHRRGIAFNQFDRKFEFFEIWWEKIHFLKLERKNQSVFWWFSLFIGFQFWNLTKIQLFERRKKLDFWKLTEKIESWKFWREIDFFEIWREIRFFEIGQEKSKFFWWFLLFRIRIWILKFDENSTLWKILILIEDDEARTRNRRTAEEPGVMRVIESFFLKNQKIPKVREILGRSLKVSEIKKCTLNIRSSKRAKRAKIWYEDNVSSSILEFWNLTEIQLFEIWRKNLG